MFVGDQTKAGVVDRGTAFGPNTFKLMDHIKKLDKSNPETGLVTVITTYNTFQYRTFKWKGDSKFWQKYNVWMARLERGGDYSLDDLALGAHIDEDDAIFAELLKSLGDHAAGQCPPALMRQIQRSDDEEDDEGSDEFEEDLEAVEEEGTMSAEEMEHGEDDEETLSKKNRASKKNPRHYVNIMHDFFDVLICDEAHKIKSPKTRTHGCLMKLAVARQILLTATVIINNASDFQGPLLLLWRVLKEFAAEDTNESGAAEYSHLYSRYSAAKESGKEYTAEALLADPEFIQALHPTFYRLMFKGGKVYDADIAAEILPIISSMTTLRRVGGTNIEAGERKWKVGENIPPWKAITSYVNMQGIQMNDYARSEARMELDGELEGSFLKKDDDEPPDEYTPQQPLSKEEKDKEERQAYQNMRVLRALGQATFSGHSVRLVDWTPEMNARIVSDL